MMTTNKLGIYIHIPFCIRKCPYCGFYSEELGTGASCSAEEYIAKVICDLKSFGEEYSGGRKVDSIFFGGGTPTSIHEDYIISVLEAIRENFDVEIDCEITIEANPGILHGLAKLKEAGFNRISIGVQSFDDGVLGTLGRIHNSLEAERSIKIAREAGFDNLNIDLMFGIPGQSMGEWNKTLKKVIDLKPEHISFYSLQLEEGTPYFDRFEAGEFDELSDELDRAMYHKAIAMLKAAGYKHYEISNASIPGFECRHNLKYWSLNEYLGVGPSASSYIDGRRFTFKDSVRDYMECNLNDLSGRLSELHINSRFDDMSEYSFTGLRLTSGIDYSDFKIRFGISFQEAFSDRWEELREFFESGAIKQFVDAEGVPVALRLTEKGIDVSNRIMSIFV